MQDRKCQQCGSQHGRRRRRELCDICYKRAWRRGEFPARIAVPPEERLDARLMVDSATGCWLFTGPVYATGYAQFYVAGRTVLAHRFQYERYVGPIPDGLQLDHLCRVRHCCNPEHLEPVTVRENLMRSPIAQAALNAAKTHCPQGHKYTPDNTYIQRTRNGGRLCRRCCLDRNRQPVSA